MRQVATHWALAVLKWNDVINGNGCGRTNFRKAKIVKRKSEKEMGSVEC